MAAGKKKLVAFQPAEDNLAGLNQVKERTSRSMSYCINQAIELYLAEVQDYEIALKRLNDPSDKIISSDEMWKRGKPGK